MRIFLAVCHQVMHDIKVSMKTLSALHVQPFKSLMNATYRNSPCWCWHYPHHNTPPAPLPPSPVHVSHLSGMSRCALLPPVRDEALALLLAVIVTSTLISNHLGTNHRTHETVRPAFTLNTLRLKLCLPSICSRARKSNHPTPVDNPSDNLWVGEAIDAFQRWRINQPKCGVLPYSFPNPGWSICTFCPSLFTVIINHCVMFGSVGPVYYTLKRNITQGLNPAQSLWFSIVMD